MDTKIILPFSEKSTSSENFNSSIGTQHFVNTEKFAFEIDDLQK